MAQYVFGSIWTRAQRRAKAEAKPTTSREDLAASTQRHYETICSRLGLDPYESK